MRLSLLAALVALLLPGCGGSEEVSPQLLPPAAFAEAVTRPGTVTLNVHVPDEGSLPGTDLAIPFDQIEERGAELPARSTPLAVYCRSGNMSAEAVETLTRLGYEDIVELAGGMEAWQAEGRQLLPPGTP